MMIEKPENRMPESHVDATWRTDWRGRRVEGDACSVADVWAAFGARVRGGVGAADAFGDAGRAGRRAAFIVLLNLTGKRPTGAAAGHPRRASLGRVTP
jgi:hypothetical protein